jgi:hypothetical protein
MFISDCSAISTSHTFPAYLTGLQTHQCSAHYTIESKRGSSAAHRCDAVIDRRPGVFYSSLNIFLRSLSVAQRPAYRIPWTATHSRAPGIRLPHRVNAFNFARWLSKSRLVCGSWYLSACARTHLRIQLHTADSRPSLLPRVMVDRSCFLKGSDRFVALISPGRGPCAARRMYVRCKPTRKPITIVSLRLVVRPLISRVSLVFFIDSEPSIVHSHPHRPRHAMRNVRYRINYTRPSNRAMRYIHVNAELASNLI